METFRYILDKSSKKHVCPSCNKKSWVFYLDTITSEFLPPDYGRCDRSTNCNYHKAPPKGKRTFKIEFLTLNSITDKACKLTDLNGIISIVPKSQILEQNKNNCWITEWYLKTSTINYLGNESKYFNPDEIGFVNEIRTTVAPPEVAPSFHSVEIFDKMYHRNLQTDNLTDFLKSKFSKDEVLKATQNYFISSTNHFWNNATVFWQIDNMDKIRSAKIMLYDKDKGKRIKEPYNHINWLHKATKEPDFNLCQCLFGLHLVNKNYQKTIAICESEKTAIVMSIFLPDFIWLATGSKGNFKSDLLEPLKKRNVIAYPDKGEYNDWLNKANDLNVAGFKIAVSNLIELTNFENGFDLADHYFKMHEM